jgi:hypothetical protein
MSTRGAIGVRIDGRAKLSYNHSSSYPSWLGERFAREVLALVERCGVERLREMARAMRPLDEQEPLDEATRRAYRDAIARLGIDAELNGEDGYAALHALQGSLAPSLEAGAFLEYSDFPYSGLFCEWAYVLDLDARTLEIHRGGHRLPGPGPYGRHAEANGYYGVHLEHVIPLDELDPERVAELDDAEPTYRAAQAA